MEKAQANHGDIPNVEFVNLVGLFDDTPNKFDAHVSLTHLWSDADDWNYFTSSSTDGLYKGGYVTVRFEAVYLPDFVLLDNHRSVRTEWVEVLIWMGDSAFSGSGGQPAAWVYDSSFSTGVGEGPAYEVPLYVDGYPL